MSVVVRHPLSKQVVVYTKGADSVIMELLSVAASDGTNPEQQMIIRERTQRHLDEYAKRGLRTLCVAKKVRLPGAPWSYCFSWLLIATENECEPDLNPKSGHE